VDTLLQKVALPEVQYRNAKGPGPNPGPWRFWTLHVGLLLGGARFLATLSRLSARAKPGLELGQGLPRGTSLLE
jgi:hypothetical protein